MSVSLVGAQPHTSSHKEEIVDGRYAVLKTIGEGEFGKVKVARHIKSGCKVAVKFVKKKDVADEESIKGLYLEANIMKQLKHPNIIRLFDIIETPEEIIMVMEWAKGGELFDYIVAHGKLSETLSRKLFRQLVAAVDHCHVNCVVHRDLKAENLLLDSSDHDGPMTLKVIDFGLSNFFQPGYVRGTFCGSPTYVAPEVMMKKKYLGPNVDVWSMGCILYAFVCGCLPFNFNERQDWADLYRKITNARYTIPPHVSPGCRDLIQRILVVDAKKRYTIEDICAHPWVEEGINSPIPRTLEPTKKWQIIIDRTIFNHTVGLGFDQAQLEKDLKENNCKNDGVLTYQLLQFKRQVQRQWEIFKLQRTVPQLGTMSRKRSMTLKPTQHKVTKHPNRETVGPLTPVRLPFLDEKDKGFERETNTPPAGHGGQAYPRIPHHGKPGGGEDGKHGGAATGTPSPHSGANTPSSANGANKKINLPTIISDSARPGLVSAPVSPTSLASPYNTHPNRTATNDSPRHTRLDSNRPPVVRTLTEENALANLKQQLAGTTLGGVATGGRNAPTGTGFSYSLAVSPSHTPRAGHTPIETPLITPSGSFEKMPPGANGPKQPRTVRFAVSVNVTSQLAPQRISDTVVNTLHKFAIHCKDISDWCLICHTAPQSPWGELEFEVEVCKLPRLSLHGVRFRRRRGNRWSYKQVCKTIMDDMDLNKKHIRVGEVYKAK
eukprot:GCRY01004908.1.p1 GENE.GCRY01004908.1~~GCRY01004908.1.p1  ORF type:complete len:718 (+),score=176.77 GCRY01004908.1:227-2380(+)